MASILLVDDHPDIRDALRAMLESDRHTVVEAEDGRAALAAWQAHKADLVLTDFSPTARRHGSPNFTRLGFCRNRSPTPRSGNRSARPFAQSLGPNPRATGAATLLAPHDTTAP